MKIKLDYLLCFTTGIIVFLFFSHTLNYPWKHFDENIIYNETVYPIPKSLSHIFEYLTYFGINNHFEASNPFYSKISNLRCDPANTIITLFVYFFFQKNAFSYHLFSLTLHAINSCLLFLILNKISLLYSNEVENKIRLLLALLLTLAWSLNPLNIESILFTANWAAIVTYFFCTAFIFYFVCLNPKTDTVPGFILTFSLSLIPFFNSEYSITLPIIIFFYIYSNYRFSKSDSTFINSIVFSLKKCLPLLLALLIFIFNFLFSPIKENIQLSSENSLELTLERIFWFSPQIFFHFIKLVLFPVNLSVDQTALVQFSEELISPYPIFCTTFMYSIILILPITFILIKKHIGFLIFTAISFFMTTLLPFLHLISPAYCLASERYLYFPLMMLIFGGSHFLFFLLYKKQAFKSLILVLVSCLVLTLGVRAYIRTLDWKDSITLFKSALKESPNDLFKGLRLEFLGSLLNDNEATRIQGLVNLNHAISILETSLQNLEQKKLLLQDTVPDIIKFYGLDPKTMQAKTAYLLAFTKLGLLSNFDDAHKVLKPHMQDLSVIDTQILDLYIGLLFGRNELDEAERILNFALRRRPSSTVLIALSELYRLKYHNMSKAEEYLKLSFKYFPYDIQTLYYLKVFYTYTKDMKNYALYSYLHGIRTHSKESLQEALQAYTYLNNTKMANKSLEHIKLLN